MSEYYFDLWQWRDLKCAVDQRNWEDVEHLIRKSENRWYTLQVAQANMINEFKYPYNSGE